MAVQHLKGGVIICTCVEGNVVGEKEEYNKLGLCGFDYK